ncbi:PQ-loop repeat-containing protein [Pseudoalteromonas piscicida]|uniref:SemiSWEET family transporter n=1 Tax=Pseudoalteromonas piscicida TaxID=43662 RepID=UPI001EFD6A46|nr:PQ-loop repeat-containing protein [Pseudoalteromonas piscicida]MCG9770187.1 PQ-loop repeat-containing protein [Pseudoalteromonas piscicida]
MSEYLPIVSSFVLVLSFVPLIRKIRKNRSVSGVSLLMMSFGVAQSSYFIAYNVFFERFFMVLPFVVTGSLSALILYYFIRYNASSKQRNQLALLLALSTLPFGLLLARDIEAAALLNALTYLGLVMSSIRVMPQTYKTIKSGDVSNLSARYFSLQFLAGGIGLAAELSLGHVSVAHVLMFVMILLTNAAQLGCIQYYRSKPALA